MQFLCQTSYRHKRSVLYFNLVITEASQNMSKLTIRLGVKHQGSVAQWITRLTTDQKIPGSTPGRLVTFEHQILSHLYSNATAHHQLLRFYPVNNNNNNKKKKKKKTIYIAP